MTREARALFLSILTLIVYAVSIFINQGALIFPFPLNEFIFLALALQFFWWNRARNRWPGILASIAGICAVMSTQFFWSFMYDTASMEIFMNSLTTDYFLLGFYVFLLVAGVFTLVKQKKGTALLLSSLFLASLIAGVFLNNALLVLLAFAFMTASTQLVKAFAPYHLLWILLLILKLTEWLTFVLNS